MSSEQGAPIRVAIVPHTHWDREWYSPFQTFRLRLVRLLDALLPMLESDLSYSRFLLDGQTAVLDDYLAVRPEAAADAGTPLASAGRLAIGPWMVLMDEFMVSGETMVRDLPVRHRPRLGARRRDGRRLPARHVRPRRADAAVARRRRASSTQWCGGACPRSWSRPRSGGRRPTVQRVRAEYLYGSYSNGRDMPDDAERLVLRARDYEHELGDGGCGDMLFMNGTDHQMPQPWLGPGRRRGQHGAGRVRVRRHVVARVPRRPAADGLVTVTGELRSGARANLLMGVGSNHVDVHRGRARWPERRARKARRAVVGVVPLAPSTRTRSPTSRGASSC